jgi:curved DNA-binding protein CbpA
MANPEGRHGATQVYCEVNGFAVALGPDQLRPSGAFVPSPAPPPLDSEIELTLRSPVGDAVLRALVVQVITREQAARSGRSAGFGVLFLDLVDDQRAFIGLTLDALDRAQRALAAAEARKRTSQTRRPRPRIPSTPLEPPVATTRKRRLSAEGTATLQRLRSELDQLPTRSPSAVLGLEPTADVETARSAFLEISKRCHPHVYARFDSAEINTAATDLFIAYKRAYGAVRSLARTLAKPPAGSAAGTASGNAAQVESATPSSPAAAPSFEYAVPIASRSDAPEPAANPCADRAGNESAPAPVSPPPPAAARALAQHLGQGFGGRVSLPPRSAAQRERVAAVVSSSVGSSAAGSRATNSSKPPIAERRAANTEIALSAALRHLAGSRFDQAELELERLCEISPEHRDSRVWLHVCRARKHKAARRPDAALEHYRAVLALDPEHREAAEHVGRGKKRGGVVGKWFSGDDE